VTEELGIGKLFVSWFPFIVFAVLWVVFIRRAVKRQGSMREIAKENTAAVRENTEMLKAVLQKLDLSK
jgi:ATP-dependent Zn protease